MLAGAEELGAGADSVAGAAGRAAAGAPTAAGARAGNHSLAGRAGTGQSPLTCISRLGLGVGKDLGQQIIGDRVASGLLGLGAFGRGNERNAVRRSNFARAASPFTRRRRNLFPVVDRIDLGIKRLGLRRLAAKGNRNGQDRQRCNNNQEGVEYRGAAQGARIGERGLAEFEVGCKGLGHGDLSRGLRSLSVDCRTKASRVKVRRRIPSSNRGTLVEKHSGILVRFDEFQRQVWDQLGGFGLAPG